LRVLVLSTGIEVRDNRGVKVRRKLMKQRIINVVMRIFL